MRFSTLEEYCKMRIDPEWYFRKTLRKWMTNEMRELIFAEILIADNYITPSYYKDAVEIINGEKVHPMPPFHIDEYGSNEYYFWKNLTEFRMNTLDNFRYAVLKRLERNIHPETRTDWIRVWNIVVNRQKQLQEISVLTITQETEQINSV